MVATTLGHHHTPAVRLGKTPSAEVDAAPAEHPEQGLLDLFANMVGEVEDHHRVVGGGLIVAAGVDGAAEVDGATDGSGIAPRGPSNGNSGVIGKYGRPSVRATGLRSAIIGRSLRPTIDIGMMGAEF